MRGYLQDLLQLSKGVRVFVTTEVFLGIGIGLYSLLLNLHLLEAGVNEALIGTISSVGALVMGVIAIPCGLLANRWGCKRLLVSGVALMGVGYAMFAFGQSLWMFFAAQVMQAVGLTLLVTTEVQLLFHYSASKREETQGFSLLFAIYTLFSGFGTLLGGYLPELIGGRWTKYDYSLLAAAFVILLGAMCRGLLLPKEQYRDKGNPVQAPKQASARKGIRLPGRSLWALAIVNLIIGGAFAFIDPFINVIVKFRLGWSDEATSLLLTLNGFCLFVGSLLMPVLLERWGIMKTYAIVFLVNIGLAVMLSLSLPAYAFSGLLVLRGGCFVLLNNLILSHSMSSLPEGERNLFAGMRSVFRSISVSAATFIAGLILAGKQYALPFLLAALTLLVGMTVFFTLIKPILAAGLEEKNAPVPEGDA